MALSEQTTAEQNPIDSSEIENQEGYAADGYPLELTDWETALVAELVELRPDWLPRAVRIAVGHSQVRVRTANDPGLVRRAFLLAAADRARPRDGYKGTWSPNRMFAAGCPFWAQAVEEVVPVSAGERVGRPDPAVPDASVGDQAAVRPVVSGREPPTAEYLAWREKEKARLGAKR